MMCSPRYDCSFVHIGDIHFWHVVFNPLRLLNKRMLGNINVISKRRHEFRIENVEAFADEVAATGVSNVVLTGDFASTSLPEEFAVAADFVRGLRRRGMTVHLLPGNHDVYTFESARRRRFEQHFSEFLPPGGYPAITMLSDGIPLILVPTVCPRILSARGVVSEDTVSKVRSLLAGCGATAVVAAHYPVLHETHGYASHLGRRLANAEALRRALGESGKMIIYVAGHVHRFSRETDHTYPNVRYVTAAAFCRQDEVTGIQGEFNEIRVGEGAFTVIRHVKRATWSSDVVRGDA